MGLSLTVNLNSVYSPFFRATTPLVSSSNSLSAHRRGFRISLRLHPPVTKIQSLNRQSLTVRNLGLSSTKLTAIAIALYFFIAHSQVIISGHVYSSSFSSSISSDSDSVLVLDSGSWALNGCTKWAEKL